MSRIVEYEEDSMDSVRSFTARSKREKRVKAVLYFTSDESTAIVDNLADFLPEVDSVLRGQTHLIKWNPKAAEPDQEVRIVKKGGTRIECEEVREAFEVLASSVGVYEAIKLCDETPTMVRKRKTCPSVRPPQAGQMPVERLFKRLPDSNVAPEVVRRVEPLAAATKPHGASVFDIAALQRDMVHAVTNAEKAAVLLCHAEHLQPRDMDAMVPVYHGFNIMIKKIDKMECLSRAKSNPGKLQRLLLEKIKGREYIKTHCARGQRAATGGLPAADADLLIAVQLYTESRFKGKEVPSIKKTFNQMSGNIRRHDRYCEGKYRYARKPKKNKNVGDENLRPLHEHGEMSTPLISDVSYGRPSSTMVGGHEHQNVSTGAVYHCM